MGCRKTWILGAALCGALLCGANSQAGSIDFIATGQFDPPTGTSVYSTTESTSVTYTSLGVTTASAPPTDNVSLGTFTTASGASASSPITIPATSFALTITDVTLGSPYFGDMITFTGTMSGTLSSTSSSASVLFSSPLSETLGGFVFTIVSGDQSTPGRLNLNNPTSNGGVSTIDALVTAAVPEPSSVVLLGLAVPALAGLAYRRARR
jgi:hypothetical protein